MSSRLLKRGEGVTQITSFVSKMVHHSMMHGNDAPLLCVMPLAFHRRHELQAFEEQPLRPLTAIGRIMVLLHLGQLRVEGH